MVYDYFVIVYLILPHALACWILLLNGRAVRVSTKVAPHLLSSAKGLTTIAVRGWQNLQVIGIAIHQSMSMLYALSATRFPHVLLMSLFGLG